jgi:hypothetical protein
MRDQMTGLPRADGTTGEPEPIVSPLFFVSFIMSGTMIFLNLLVGVIVNSMSELPEGQAKPDGAPGSPLPSLHAPGADAPHPPLVAERLARLESALAAATRELEALRQPAGDKKR